VVTLPQSNFRGKLLTFDEFCDLTIIGMAGLTDYLMKATDSSHVEGMVNYKLVADTFLLDPPRLMHPPMDGILAIDFV
jgi:hypothetical protein